MKNKSIIFAVIGLLVLGGIIYSTTRSKPSATITQTYGTYSIKSDSAGKTYAVNTPSSYSFSIIDSQGNTLKDFAITHTKLLHLIVVRKDLAYFQHVHPDFNKATGQFTLPDLTFPADGQYRIFADFAPASAPIGAMGMPESVTPFEDVSVGTGVNYTPVPLGSEETTKTFDGMQVSLMTHGALTSGSESMLMYNLMANGKPVTDLQTYLGALGHAVILRQDNLDFIHAHPSEDPTAPQTGNVDFMVDFPEVGTYKVFTQFQRNGKVITTDFVLTVTQGNNSSSSMQGMQGMDMNMQGMNHSMHN